MARLASKNMQTHPKPHRSLPSAQTIDQLPKRSISILAKNGQLPARENDVDYSVDGPWSQWKRNIGSIARGGLINGKRNIGALARDYSLPATQNSGKRNLPSILRAGGGGGATTSSSTHEPQSPPKRNLASIARDNMYPSYHQTKVEKRDVAAVSNVKRKFLGVCVCVCVYCTRLRMKRKGGSKIFGDGNEFGDYPFITTLYIRLVDGNSK